MLPLTYAPIVLTHYIPLVIDRKIWLRGDMGSSCLHRAMDGKECCLGILGRSRGIPISSLCDRITPGRVTSNYWHLWPDGISCCSLFDGDYILTKRLMRINDDPDMSEIEREARLTVEFRKINILVTFIN